MHIDDDFSQLLGSIYEGPLQQPPWQDFLAAVRELLGAGLVTLLLRPPSEEDQAVMLADGGSLSAMQSYNEGQFVLDPFVDLPPGEVISLHEFLTTDALLASDFYRIIMEPQGWYDFLGLDLREEGELDVRFRVGRYHGAKPFGEAEKALLAALQPHLERAIRLHTRISRSERERAVYAGAVEQLAVATIILDEQCQVLSANETAAALLQEGDAVCQREGQLLLTDKTANQELALLVAEVMQSRQQSQPAAVRAMQLTRSGDASDLGLVAKAVPRTEGAEGRGIPSVAIFISDPTQVSEPPRQVISRLFGFTPTEANLAMLLANGLTLDEASAELGVSRNTVRTHLRAVFAKTGVSRQTGLVRLILNSVAPLAGEETT